MADTARLRFVDDGEPDPADVGHFMFLFRAAYAAAVGRLRPADQSSWPVKLPSLELRLRTYLEGLDLADTTGLFSAELGKQGLSVRRLAVESPLDIILVGTGAALALAVILSGGTVKFDAKTGSFEASLPALGDGIRKLREAFAPKSRAHLDYGVRPLRVKLSKGELAELMRYDPRTERKGGFQRVLIGIQYRTNLTTREVELSAHDVDVILRHGRQPKKGGFQSSIRKIFGHHFDLDA